MASTWAWKDREHVEKNRREYDDKYRAAIACFESNQEIKRPDGGFYIWMKLPCNDEEFAKKLYEDSGVLTLPGTYLGRENHGYNPGEGYLRLAVVHDVNTVTKAFTAVNNTLSGYK